MTTPTKPPTNLFAQVYQAFGGRSPGGTFVIDSVGDVVFCIELKDLSFCPDYVSVISKLNTTPLFGCARIMVVDSCGFGS